MGGAWRLTKEWKGEKSPLLFAHAGQKEKLWRDQIKENRSLSLWGWMVPVLKMRRFLYLLPTRNGWDSTHTYIYFRNRMVSSIKMSGNRLVNIIVLYGTKVFSKSVSIWQICSENRLFLWDEGPKLETLDYTIGVGSTPTLCDMKNANEMSYDVIYQLIPSKLLHIRNIYKTITIHIAVYHSY